MTSRESWTLTVEDAGGWTAPGQVRLLALVKRMEKDFGLKVASMRRTGRPERKKTDGGAK